MCSLAVAFAANSWRSRYTGQPALQASVCRLRCSTVTKAGLLPTGFSARRARLGDLGYITTSLVSEGMNPLGIHIDRLLVVEETGSQSEKSRVVAFGQMRPISQKDLELASIYVAPEFRRRGIASVIVALLLERERAKKTATTDHHHRRVFCLTVGSEKLYQKHGFVLYPLEDDFVWNRDIPCVLRLEILLGRVVSRIVKPEAPLVLLCRTLEGQQ